MDYKVELLIDQLVDKTIVSLKEKYDWDYFSSFTPSTYMHELVSVFPSVYYNSFSSKFEALGVTIQTSEIEAAILQKFSKESGFKPWKKYVIYGEQSGAKKK